MAIHIFYIKFKDFFLTASTKWWIKNVHQVCFFAFLGFYSIYEGALNWIILYIVVIVQYYSIFYMQNRKTDRKFPTHYYDFVIKFITHKCNLSNVTLTHHMLTSWFICSLLYFLWNYWENLSNMFGSHITPKWKILQKENRACLTALLYMHFWRFFCNSNYSKGLFT